MADFKNMSKVDMLNLSEMCLDICNDKAVKLGDWSQRDIDLFVAQFKEADLEPSIDMDKLDYKAYPRSYFEKKFNGFDDNVIDALYECENKKLEDDRLCPLRVLRDRVGTLSIENPSTIYNADQDEVKDTTEAEAEEKSKEAQGTTEAEAGAEADGDSATDRARWFTEANEADYDT